jgi:hypothetical protein
MFFLSINLVPRLVIFTIASLVALEMAWSVTPSDDDDELKNKTSDNTEQRETTPSAQVIIKPDLVFG